MGDFRDKAEHKADEAKGAAKEKIGRAADDPQLEGEGTGEKLRAKAEGMADEAKEKAGDAAAKIKGMMKNR